MKFCDKCGTELHDDAVVCTGCGCAVVENEFCAQVEKPKVKRKVKVLWIVLSAVVLLLGAVAAILFMPRNLRMDDIKETTVVTAIIRYGLPEKITNGPEGTILHYGEKVDFYGITPLELLVFPETNEVSIAFWAEDGAEAYKKISQFCELDENLMNMFHCFRYEDLYITTFGYDASHTHIDIG